MIAREPWLARLKRTYIGNPTATRDMRVQLRGNRAVILFSVYLFVMGLVLMFAYESAMRDGTTSLASAQSSLEGFYYATLSCLGIVVTLVAPAMGAFAVVQEKQRRSLDLVFSAPVEPKQYLVGKLISSYRYVWLLLILSLPFCAVSVTLGGATWSQLFITFFLFSCYGLLCASFGLLMSVYCNKPLPAIIWTYAAVGAYVCITAFLFALLSNFGRSSAAASPIGSLSPFSFPMQYGQSALIWTKEVPTWIISVILHLVICKFVILSAGAQLAASDTKEIAGLRIHGLIYAAMVSWLVAVATDVVARSVIRFSSSRSQEVVDQYFGRGGFMLLTVVAIMAVPYLSTMSSNDLRRHRPDGVFNFKEVFSGKVSGNTPYLVLLFLVVTLTYTIGAGYYGQGMSYSGAAKPSSSSGLIDFRSMSLDYLAFIGLAFGFWFLAHSFGYWIVSKKGTLSQGRTASAFIFIILLLIPTAVLSIIVPEGLSNPTGLWLINPLTGILTDQPGTGVGLCIMHTVAMTIISMALYSTASLRMRQRALGLNP